MRPSVSLTSLTVPAHRWLSLTNPSLLDSIPTIDFGPDPQDIVEYSGRWDYGPASISKMGDRSIIGRWLATGEESMVEMLDVGFMIECSRVLTHELVRHRIASYQQESQRFVKYDAATASDLYVLPPEIEAAGNDAVVIFWDSVQSALDAYRALKGAGVKSQIARYVLPNATGTHIIAKMNAREWRHVLHLRLHSSAQPEIREVMEEIHRILLLLLPELFEDIAGKIEAGRASR